ncbi:MAG TPA: asparagine synthase (glutamine-hydrolyzing) [Gemmatimonadaceae bacterium]|nr:asparagine synthase (glutamine-hydrolyzing) [Gemmatimonadaceae bacterium]
MCGLAGFWSPTGLDRSAAALTRDMTDALRHRGPDDAGAWADVDAGVALGHRRLSIIDLSAEGHQPMRSASGRFVIVFNGEIYNFRALRAELAGVAFRGHSDTEVLLAAIERCGVVETLRRAAGMFALALWDARDRVLHLARDRAGEKPLYVGEGADGTLLFGSELRALRAHPAFDGEIDRDALALLLRHNYIPAPHTIHRRVQKVAPGTVLSVRRADGRLVRETTRYWSARAAAETGVREPLANDERGARRALDACLREVVGEQMIADVPLGAFLSGGIDSSLVVAIMRQVSAAPVRTFTIGFADPRYDEAAHARAVARHLGTEHTELQLSPAELLDVVPRLPAIYDEPFADSSQIPTYLVAALARRSVTVALSGDGGDELFGGYTQYGQLDGVWRRVSRLPRAVRPLYGAMLRGTAPYAERAAALAGAAGRYPQLGFRLARRGAVHAAPTPEEVHRRLVSHWADPASVVLGAGRDVAGAAFGETSALPRVVERVMLLDFCSYLPDDVLVKVDRATMAVSLESRAPLLDHRVVELAWRIPFELKRRGDMGKYLLRSLLHEYVPREIVDRPKRGFAVPLADWLRGPLHDWAGDLLAPDRLRREGFFEVRTLMRRWREHARAEQDWSAQLWPVLMFQAWHAAQSG